MRGFPRRQQLEKFTGHAGLGVLLGSGEIGGDYVIIVSADVEGGTKTTLARDR